MKKIIAIILAVFTAATLCSVFASAEAYNPADGCKTTVQIKKADPSVVIKDGVIGEGEYEEIEINRDPDSTDCLLSWHGGGELFDSAAEFLKNVHFYMSWDDVHGLNVAVKCLYLETPNQVNEKPAEDRMSNNGENFPGDEFIAQCGVMFNVVPGENDTTGRDMIFYRGIARRTDNGEYLVGHYGETSQGYDYSAPQLVGGENLIIVYDGNWATYEFSVPVSAVVANASGVGESFEFNITAVGGGVGVNFENAKVYAVSIGDDGYMTSKNAATEPAHGLATFTNTPVVPENGGEGDVPDGDNGESGSKSDDVGGNTENGGNKGTNTNPGDTYGSANDGGDVTPVDGENGAQNGTNNKPATKTGDAMVILAVVSALSAGGVMISKKQR